MSQRNLINVLFAKQSNFILPSGEIDSLKVVSKLKENGLLKLSYKTAQPLRLNFEVSGSPLLSMKIITNVLEKLGYTYYISTKVSKHSLNLSWAILINTQNVLDPISFSRELIKRECKIQRVQRSGELFWQYNIDANSAMLLTASLLKGEENQLKKPNSPYWLDTRGITNLKIRARDKDNWYPNITFFDKNLIAFDAVIKDVETKELLIKIPQNARYIKIDDKFLLDNIKRGLLITPN